MSINSATFLQITGVVLLITLSSLSFAQEAEKNVEAIVFDIRDGRILAVQAGEGFSLHRPVGSLAKPLVSYALFASGKSDDDVFFCRSSSADEKSTKTCWYKPGHGNLTFTSALALSCNAWFRQWLIDAENTEVIKFFSGFNIADPTVLSSFRHPGMALSGLEGNCSISVLNCAAAFATLFNGGIKFAVRDTREGITIAPIGAVEVGTKAAEKVAGGMRECCSVGTGSAFGKVLGAASALVKTGTAYAQTAAGVDVSQTDGWCIALYPAEEPSYLVLVRLAGGSGAEAAGEAARFLGEALEKNR